MGQLDSLRAIAAVLVVLHHYLQQQFPIVHTAGRARVMLFFVLSGLLITRMLLSARRRVERHEVSAGHTLAMFYLRRVLRVAPLLYVAIALTWILGDADLHQGAWAWHAAFGSNLLFWHMQTWPATTSHLWSLGVEMQFYLLWPVLVWTVPRPRLRQAMFVCLACGPLTRAVLPLVTHNEFGAYVLPASVLDGFAVGGLLALLKDDERARARKMFGWIAVLAAAGFAAMTELEHHPGVPLWASFAVDDALLALVAGGIVAGAMRGYRGAVGFLLDSAPLRYVGRLSYGIYVWHLFVPFLLWRVLGAWTTGTAGYWQLRAAWLAGTIVLSVITWHLVEEPASWLRERLTAKPAPRAAVAPQAIRLMVR